MLPHERLIIHHISDQRVGIQCLKKQLFPLSLIDVETLSSSFVSRRRVLTHGPLNRNFLKNDDCWDALGVDAIEDDIAPGHASVDLAIIIECPFELTTATIVRGSLLWLLFKDEGQVVLP